RRGGVPRALRRVDAEPHPMREHFVLHVAEDVELRLGPPVTHLGDPRCLEVLLGLLGDVARVPRVRLLSDGVVHVAEDGQGRDRGERVRPRRPRIGHQEHVALLDRLEAADAAAVEPDPLGEGLLVQLAGGDRGVLPGPRDVDELEIHHLDAVFLDVCDDVARRHLPAIHSSTSASRPGPRIVEGTKTPPVALITPREASWPSVRLRIRGIYTTRAWGSQPADGPPYESGSRSGATPPRDA